MPRVTLGVILGLSIGTADVLLMLPLFPGQTHGPSRSLLVALFARVLRRHDQLADVSDRGWPSRGTADEHSRRDRDEGLCADSDNRGDIRGGGWVDRRTMGGAILTGAGPQQPELDKFDSENHPVL